MSVSKRRNGPLLALLALAATAIFLLPVSQAAANEFPNACVNNADSTKASSIPVTMTAKTSPAGPAKVKAGDSIKLEEIKQELAIPPSVFLSGYGLELLTTGLNKIPTNLRTLVRGTNTVQESQLTNTVETEAETTIMDPTPGNPASGDETATPGKVVAEYADETWTAGASGPINFREATEEPLTTTTGGIRIVAKVGAGGLFSVKFGCDPGEVVEAAPPSTIKLKTASAFASLENVDATNRAPTANAGPDQRVSPGIPVKLNGFESSDSNEESFALKYKWTQTGGLPVTLSGGTTPGPTFTAPSEPAALIFKLEVCESSGPMLCGTDTVRVNVGNLPPTANAGPAQEVDSGAGVTLDGSGSSDPNGDPLTYKWTQTGGPGVALGGAETANATFTAPTGPATLGFQLEVCDNGEPALCSTASVAVTVKAPAGGGGPGPGSPTPAPNTKLGSVKITKRNVTIKFSSDQSGSTFLCKLDKGKFAKCKSPKTYKNLKPGKHKFEVKATNAQGVADSSPTVKKFKIKG